jgi:hypothetical protein
MLLDDDELELLLSELFERRVCFEVFGSGLDAEVSLAEVLLVELLSSSSVS